MPSLDPTKTAALRRRYTQAMNRRFRELAQDVRESFVAGALSVNEAARQGDFDRPTLIERVQAFSGWLQAQIASRILEQVTPFVQRLRGHWQNVFVRAAYLRGITSVESELRAAGELSAPVPSIEVALRSGIHKETLDLMNARVFEGLRGITDDMAARLSDIFSRSLIEGVGPSIIAKRITDQIGSISKRRAMVMARTEIVRVYSEARLNTMERNNIDGVTAEVEAQFTTAGDARVCQICRGLNGRTFTIQQARGVIPVHAQCRCTWTSVLKESRSAA